MKILYLTFDGLTDPLGSSQILPYLAGAARAGHDVHIVSLEKHRAISESGNETRERVKSSGLTWQPLPFTARPSIVSSLWNLWKMWRAAEKMMNAHDFEILHCRSYMTSLLGLVLKRRFRCKFLFDMRGFWPDERVDGGLWNLKHPLFLAVYKFFKSKEAEFLSEADAVVSLTHAGKREILRRHPRLSPSSITVIPCCTDLIQFCGPDTELKKTVRSELSISEDSIVLTYVGSLGTWYCLDEMLDFFRVFLKTFESAIFLIVTREPAQMIWDCAKRKDVPTSRIRITSSPPPKVPRFLAAADIGLSFILPSYSKIASSPTKLGEMLAMGLPVISNAGVGDSDFFAAQGRVGPLVANFSTKAYEQAISEMQLSLTEFRQRARLQAEELFDLEMGIEKYLRLYREVARSANRL